MIARARSYAVLILLAGGAIAVIAGTQIWLVVTLAGEEQLIEVSGSVAVPVLSPLALATLALGGALAVAGRVLRYVFATLALVISVVIAIASVQIALWQPLSAVAGSVAEATGISGESGLEASLAQTSVTAWPAITSIAALLIFGAGVWVMLTAHRWSAGGRRYRSATENGPRGQNRNGDAIDSWDDLSRGQDPTV